VYGEWRVLGFCDKSVDDGGCTRVYADYGGGGVGFGCDGYEGVEYYNAGSYYGCAVCGVWYVVTTDEHDGACLECDELGLCGSWGLSELWIMSSGVGVCFCWVAMGFVKCIAVSVKEMY
jgi:hypothetical protein